MQIKIECGCGTKYGFDVEPVNGRMPMPVNCPACGQEGTDKANAILQELLARTSREEVSPMVAAPQSLKPAAGLRLQAAGSVPANSPQAPPPVLVSLPQARKPAGKLKTALLTCLTVAVVGFGLWRFGMKWYKRLSAVAEVVQAVASGKNSSEETPNQNFGQEDCVMLFIRHTNHLEVAQACKDYWKDRLHKTLSVTEVQNNEIGEREYCLIGEHNGYIRLTGGLEWAQPHYEGLAQEISRRFNTLVFEIRDVDFTGAYHFGVYEQGTRKFHAQMDVKLRDNDFQEVVTTEGNEWALAHGFKPGPEGFNEFHMGHADEISQKMGLKMWDEKEDENPPVLLLKEL